MVEREVFVWVNNAGATHRIRGEQYRGIETFKDQFLQLNWALHVI